MANEPVRIIGLDPGLRRTGWGVVVSDGARLRWVAHGVVAKVIRALTTTGFSDFFDWQLPNGGSLVVVHASSGPLIRFSRPSLQD